MSDAEKAAEAWMLREYDANKDQTYLLGQLHNAYLAGYAAAQQWRPIESAPRDGTEILVWNKGNGLWAASFRFPRMGEPQFGAHLAKEWRDSAGRWATPTKWMPLPKPPEAG